MASVALSRRVEKVVGYPPLSEMNDQQRREFHESLLDAASFEDLPGKWQAAILEAEEPAEAAPRFEPLVLFERSLVSQRHGFEGLGPRGPGCAVARSRGQSLVPDPLLKVAFKRLRRCRSTIP